MTKSDITQLDDVGFAVCSFVDKIVCNQLIKEINELKENLEIDVFCIVSEDMDGFSLTIITNPNKG